MENPDDMPYEIRERYAGNARARKALIRLAILLVIGVAYLIWCNFSEWRIPCVIHSLTGYDCPGCGMTRAFVAVSKLDFKAAFEYNALAITLIPVLIIFLVCQEVRYVRTGSRLSRNRGVKRFEVALVVLMVLVTVLYGILRNIPGFK